MPETKRFDLGTILSVTTGRLLTTSRGDGNGIDALYELLGWMTSDSPYTHQLGRFAAECKPWLLRWFPELEGVQAALPLLNTMLGPQELRTGASVRQACSAWLRDLCAATNVRPEYDVPKIPADAHERKDPIEELVAMRGSAEGIIVVDPGQERAGGPES